MEAIYLKSKNAVTSTPYSQTKSLTSVSQAKLYLKISEYWIREEASFQDVLTGRKLSSRMILQG